MFQNKYPLFLGNKAELTDNLLEVTDKYTGQKVTSVALANAKIMETAITMAHESSPLMAALKPYERQNILYACVEQFKKRFNELAFCLCIEAGKPIKDAEGEVLRLIDTFRVAAEEAVRIGGRTIPMEISPRAKGYTGMTRRIPIGPCLFISPFNFPLNLIAHKIAPAIAAGCPFVLKPASKTPVSALITGEILAGTDLPRGAFSILPSTRKIADQLVTDNRFKLLSFTGSDSVGWELKSRAGKKKVVLELGGNAACIVDETADINDAAKRLITGIFYQSGQSCISVQRIFAHEKIYNKLRDLLVTMAKKLKTGDPKERETFIGPMIDEEKAECLQAWINEAVSAGGKLLCGNQRKGPMMAATLLEDVPVDQKICTEEAFGPVAVISRFNDFKHALDGVNNSRYGLQAGVFTRDLYRAKRAWDTLDVGGVIIGDIPSLRIDHMPYGGVKNSGLGREGLAYSIKNMTEIRLLVIRDCN